MSDDKAVYILNCFVFTAQYDVPKGTRCTIWKDDGGEYVDLFCAVGGIIKGVARRKLTSEGAWEARSRKTSQGWMAA